MSAHTPGPWVAIQNQYSRYEIHYAGGQLAGVAKWDDPASPPTIPEMHANARLIAAAPDLLLAAEAAARIFDGGPVRVSREYAGDLEIIRAAIAKAVG